MILLLGAQASRLHGLKEEDFKVWLKPQCFTFQIMQAGRLRSQQGRVHFIAA